jgi:DNA-binding transcriptional LysR family regulator
MDRFAEMETFVRVVEDGGFSAAAKSLHLTPSGVSRTVARLEDRLAARLLNRTTRRLSLTEEGRHFHQRCLRILADVDAAERAVGVQSDAPRGILRVNAPMAFGAYQIAPVMPGFLKRYPYVHVELTLTDWMVDIIGEGLDVAISFGAVADSSLIVAKLGEDRRIICAAPRYLEDRGVPLQPEDLRNHTCLLRSRSMAELNEWPFDGMRGVYRMTVSGPVEVNNTEALLRMALAGVGIARLPGFLVGPYIRDGRLVPVLMARHRGGMEPIYAVYPHRRHLTRRTRVFVDYLVETFTPNPPWALPDTG